MNEKERANDEKVDRKKTYKKKEEKERNDINKKYSLFISYYNHYGTIFNRGTKCVLLCLEITTYRYRNVRDIPKDVTQTGNGTRRKLTQNMEKKNKE